MDKKGIFMIFHSETDILKVLSYCKKQRGGSGTFTINEGDTNDKCLLYLKEELVKQLSIK